MRTHRIALPALLLLTLAGCGIFQPIDPGADKLVVQVERATQVAAESLNTFFEVEKQNRATMPPALTEAANNLRRVAPDALRSVREATKLYKSTRNPVDADTMNAKLFAVETLARQARLYLAQYRASH